MFRQLAHTCYRRRRSVVLAWIGLLIVAIVASSSFGGELRNDFTLPGSPSQLAADLLEAGGFQRQAGERGQIVIAADGGVDDPAVTAAASRFFESVEAEVAGVNVTDPFAADGLVSPDGSVAIAEVAFGGHRAAGCRRGRVRRQPRLRTLDPRGRRGGDTVAWLFEDSTRHDVSFDDEPASPIQKSGTWSRTFDEPGRYDYVCTLHDDMTGTVEVSDAEPEP